jgi:hypothetical protein
MGERFTSEDIEAALPNKATASIISGRATYLFNKYGDNIIALFAYGSLVYGKPREGSIPDFLVIIRDIIQFHNQNEEFYKNGLTIPSTPEEQIKLNEIWPNFYQFNTDEGAMKVGIMSHDYFLNAATGDNMYVQGRIQKPLGIILSNDEINDAILTARKKGTNYALNIVKSEFTFHDFAYALASLSYLAEIRPEKKSLKINDIVTTGYEEFVKIYIPILNEIPFIQKKGEDSYLDKRADDEREEEKRKTLEYLNRQKWSKSSINRIFRNAMNYKHPISYILAKIKGEFEKAYRR